MWAQEILLRLLQQEDTHPYWRKRALLALGGSMSKATPILRPAPLTEQALHIQIPAGPYLYEQGALDEAINELLSRLYGIALTAIATHGNESCRTVFSTWYKKFSFR